jgi:hypothetical protein
VSVCLYTAWNLLILYFFKLCDLDRCLERIKNSMRGKHNSFHNIGCVLSYMQLFDRLKTMEVN